MSETLIDAHEVGRRVRLRREQAGLSQSRLAQLAGLSPSYVSLIESGRRVPARDVLVSLAAALGAGLDELVHGSRAPVDQLAGLALDRARLELSEGEARAALDRLSELDLGRLRPAVRVQVLLARAQAHELLGDLEAAVAVLEPVLVDARERGDRFDASAATMALLGCLIESGDLDRAVAEGEVELASMEADSLIGTDEHLRLGATVLWALVERGDLLTASNRAAHLVHQAESVGTARGRGSVYWTAAMVAEERQDFALAKRYTERAVALLGEYDGPRDLPRLRLRYAHVLLVQTPPEPLEALGQLDRTEPLLRAVGSQMELAIVDIYRSRAHLMLGRPEQARDLATAALGRLTDGPLSLIHI